MSDKLKTANFKPEDLNISNKLLPTAVGIVPSGQKRVDLNKELLAIINRMFLNDARVLKQVPTSFKNSTVSETELSGI